MLALLVAAVAIAPSTGAQSTASTASPGQVRVLPDDALGRAMRDELARSVKELKLADLDRPYFIAYRVDEVDGVMAAGTRGTLLGSDRTRGRYLSVELRVGDYTFDNTGTGTSSRMTELMIKSRNNNCYVLIEAFDEA